MAPKSVEDSGDLQELYNQVWAAFTDESNASNDGDLDNIYGVYADDNSNDVAPPKIVTNSPPPPPPPRVPHKCT